MGKVKGTILVPLVKALRVNRERAQECVPPALHKYLQERVLPSSWYPAKDHVALAKALSMVMPLGDAPFIMMGRGAAQHDLNGIYRAQLHAGDPQRTLAGATALWRTYCDSGEMVPTFDGPRAATVVVRNYADTSREMCGIAGGYILELLTIAGGRDPKLRKVECRLDGAPMCRWHITWS